MEAGEVAAQALAVLRAGDAAQAWTIDASALQTFDSACLALLLELRRHTLNRAMQLRGVPLRLQHLATAYGLDFALGETAVAAAGPVQHS
jgi:phospholipid transport system transporter-binding protein